MTLRWLEKRKRQQEARKRLGLPVFREESPKATWPPPFDDEARALRGIAEDYELDVERGVQAPTAAWEQAERDAKKDGTAGWLIEADLPRRMRSGSGRLYWWNGKRYVLSRECALPYLDRAEAKRIAEELHGETGIPMRVSVAVVAWVLYRQQPDSTRQWWGGVENSWVSELSRAQRFTDDLLEASRSLESEEDVEVEFTTLVDAKSETRV